MSKSMNKQWITISEAVALTRKAEMTIRRFVTEYKTDIKSVKKEKGKYYINAEILKQTYHFVNTEQKSNTETETKHKKEAMQIAYNSEIIKAKDEHIREKDKQIEMLIKSRDKKSYLAFYVTIGFIILIIVIGIISYYLFTGYKDELVNNQKSKISDIQTANQKEVSIKDEIIKSKETNLKETKKTLKETRTAYQQSLKAVDLLHVKYNDKIDHERKLLEVKENHYQQKIKQLEKELNELSASLHPKVEQGKQEKN